MSALHDDELCTLYLGDCVEVMRELPAESVDAIVTDPPYGLEFMGVAWDTIRDGGTPRTRNEWGDFGSREHARTADEAPRIRRNKSMALQAFSEAWAREAFRVAKPGAHLLALGGTRTYHRLASAIEDAGWEIRDCLVWAYASGFPKSLDVSKAIDKATPLESSGTLVPTAASGAVDYSVEPRSVNGLAKWPVAIASQPAFTPDAQKWNGWGTALKPAWEPIVMARKPLRGTVAANVLAHGTGALNIDATRIASGEDQSRKRVPVEGAVAFGEGYEMGGDGSPLGRWPANLLLSDPELFDEPNPEVVGSGAVTSSGDVRAYERANRAGFSGPMPEQSEFDRAGDTGGYSRFFRIPQRGTNAQTIIDRQEVGAKGGGSLLQTPPIPADGAVEPSQAGVGSGRRSSDASHRGLANEGYPKAFLIPKSSRSDREPLVRGVLEEREVLIGAEGHKLNPMTGKPVVDIPRANSHPTVKPLDLMRHLVRLVTPPGGTVLDCFLGSGTTAIAAEMEGFAWIGIEKEPEYVAIAEARLNGVQRGLGLDVAAPTRKRGRSKDGAIGGNGLGSHYDRLGNTKRGVDFRTRPKQKGMAL